MTKMSKAQRTAILDFHNGVTAKGHTLVASARTITVLVREGWAVHPAHVTPAVAEAGKVRVTYVTRAGLIAAGVNMDKLHAKALTEWTVRDDDPRDDAVRAEAVRYNMRGGRGDARLWAVDIVRKAAHADALAEYREVTRAARKADADAYQRELLRAAGLKVKGDPIPVLDPLRST